MELPEWWDEAFDPHCLEGGRIASLWAALEYAIDQLIWKLMGVGPTIGACVTAQMIGTGPRIRALLALTESRDASGDARKRLRKLDINLGKLQGKRNRYQHDTMVVGLENKIVRRREITADRTLRMISVPASVDEARDLWIKISKKCQDLYIITNLIFEQPLKPIEPSEERRWANQRLGNTDQDSDR